MVLLLSNHFLPSWGCLAHHCWTVEWGSDQGGFCGRPNVDDCPCVFLVWTCAWVITLVSSRNLVTSTSVSSINKNISDTPLLDVSFSHCSVTGIERYFHGLGQEWSLPESRHSWCVFPWFNADVKRQRYKCVLRWRIADTSWAQGRFAEGLRSFGKTSDGISEEISDISKQGEFACHHQVLPPPQRLNVSGRLEGNSSRSPANYGGWGLYTTRNSSRQVAQRWNILILFKSVEYRHSPGMSHEKDTPTHLKHFCKIELLGIAAWRSKTGLKEIWRWQDVDADGSGVIDYTEFLAATLDRSGNVLKRNATSWIMVVTFIKCLRCI